LSIRSFVTGLAEPFNFSLLGLDLMIRRPFIAVVLSAVIVGVLAARMHVLQVRPSILKIPADAVLTARNRIPLISERVQAVDTVR